MATKLYKVYPARDYDTLDSIKFTTNIRWSNDGSEFLVEFKEQPHGNTVVLTHQEAVDLISTEEWRYPDDLFEV